MEFLPGSFQSNNDFARSRSVWTFRNDEVCKESDGIFTRTVLCGMLEGNNYKVFHELFSFAASLTDYSTEQQKTATMMAPTRNSDTVTDVTVEKRGEGTYPGKKVKVFR